MDIIEKQLISGEAVFYETGVHESVFFPPLFAIIGAILLLIAHRIAMPIYGYFLLTAGGVWTFYALSLYATQKIILTNRRLFVQTGLLKQKLYAIWLWNIVEVLPQSSLLGNILSYGTFNLEGQNGEVYSYSRIRDVVSLCSNIGKATNLYRQQATMQAQAQQALEQSVVALQTAAQPPQQENQEEVPLPTVS